jgi:BirA family transcriptional regulator, biotin operon repressor / biotin---[acetyl-CoA-carboxylase] ligase
MVIGSNLIFYNELPSTNTEAALLLKSGEQIEGTVIHTDFQSAGKGQAGNKWESENGKNLLFSVILYPQSISPYDQFLVSMTISLGICDFLDRLCTGARIKWPNDIYLGNGKIAGILIENSILGTMIETSVAGIGLNINQESFASILPRPVSLKMATGKEYNISDCLQELLSDLDRRYKHLMYGDRNLIKHDYLARLYRFMEWSSFSSAGSVFTGRITDVLISGQIMIEEKGGLTREFSFKDFSYLS